MALINEAVCTALKNSGLSVVPIDLAPRSLARSVATRAGRAWPILKGLLKVAAVARRTRTVYVAVSGGLGQIYELIFVVLARASSRQVVLHHHSFAYLKKHSLITAVLCRCAGARALHVALSPGMASLLRSRYPGARNVLSMSNAGLCGPVNETPQRTRSNLTCVGFLGNISRDKGIFTFLDTLALLQARRSPVRGRIAGPFQSREVETVVRERLFGLGNVQYVGPVYGNTKATFLSGIDVLLFPSTYGNEADPLTVHEALASGVPVISSVMGCLPEVIDGECGAVIDDIAKYSTQAADLIERWRVDRTEYARRSRAALVRFRGLHDGSRAVLARLVEVVRGPVVRH